MTSFEKRCNPDFDQLEEEMQNFPDDIESLKLEARILIWATAAEIPGNLKSVKYAAMLVTIEFKPLGTELCASGHQAVCLGLIISFLNESVATLYLQNTGRSLMLC